LTADAPSPCTLFADPLLAWTAFGVRRRHRLQKRRVGMSKVRKILIAGAAGVTILSSVGASAVASAHGRGPDRGPSVTSVADMRGAEREAGDDRGREAEARGRMAEGEREGGDALGREAEPGDDRVQDAGAEDRHGPNRHDDGPNYDRGDDHCGDRGGRD
jgi:hypothetical protein